jgi:carboxypeptidase Taq
MILSFKKFIRASFLFTCTSAFVTQPFVASTATTTALMTATARAAADCAAASTAINFEEHSKSYKELLERLREITHLNHAAAVLNYDRQVFMPQSDRPQSSRGKQLAVLATIAHEKATDPSIGKLIDEATADLNELLKSSAEESVESLATARRILEIEKDAYTKSTCIPKELAARKASLEASANHAWVKARQSNDFASFAPALKDCFDLAAEIASLQRGENAEISLYSQMLDQFEMGMPSSRIDELFEQVQSTLVPFIAKIRASENAPSLEALSGKFNIDAQKSACQKIVTAIGFDEGHGRIDVSVHPFTMSLSGADVRITSRFSDDEWYQGLMGTIHEGGHAMYEQNLGDSELSLDSALSMGVHESQSLFWERHIGKSRAFYEWARPILMEAFNTDDNKFEYSAEELYAAVNAVDFNNLIRVEADELTYPLQ